MKFQGISLEMSRERFENGEWKSYILEAYNMSKNARKSQKSKIEKLKHDGGKVAAEILEKHLDGKYNNGRNNNISSISNSISVFVSLKELRKKKQQSTSST